MAMITYISPTISLKFCYMRLNDLRDKNFKNFGYAKRINIKKLK